MQLPPGLREAVLQFAVENPDVVADLLRIASDITTAYMERLRRQRDGNAANAITTLAGFAFDRGRKLKPIPSAYLLDAIWHQYPSGLCTRTVYDDKMLAIFLDGCRREPLKLDWIETTRGTECAAWFSTHIQPTLETKQVDAEALTSSPGRGNVCTAQKQVIIIRADLKLRRGKEAAQVAHAASMWLRDFVIDEPTPGVTQEQDAWLRGNYRKIVVKATTEKQLRDLAYEAEQRGLTTHLVVDDGLTEVPPGTVTALAIGPHHDSVFVGLTDHLPLY